MKKFLIVLVLLIVASIVVYHSCNKNQEGDIEVTGQAAQVYGYNFHAYNPLTYNPITGAMGGYGKNYSDFCVWFTVKNKGNRDLVFDAVQAYWFFGDGFFQSSLSPERGTRFIISPDSSRQFSLSTGMRGDEFAKKYGDSAVNFFFILTAVTNSPEEMNEWRKKKNRTPEEIEEIKEAIKYEFFGPFISSNIPSFGNLPICNEREVYFGAKNKYYPLKFFLVNDDFRGKDIDKWRQRH